MLNTQYLFDCRVEDEASNRTVFQKQLREVESQLQEVQEDLDTEKDARNRAEKQKRDLRYEYNLLKTLLWWCVVS